MEILTEQENRVSFLIAQGYSEKQIAAKLFIEESTVHTHARNIRKKTGAKNIADVTRLYILANPRLFFIAVLFLMIQLFTVVVDQESQERRFKRLSRNGKRVRKELII